jgi:iron complex outermembrane recepter protein
MVEFHVEAGDAATTLTEFSRQARLQLLFDYNLIKGHPTKALNGVYEPSEGLRRLLADTDLVFEFVNSRTLTVTAFRANGPLVAGEPKREKRRPRRALAKVPNNMGYPEHEVRITGTNLRGESPVGAEIVSFNREAIEATGAATVPDFLRTLPQAFGGGPNQDTHIGAEARTNSGLGVGVNLRGLGAGATLVLINGRRIAPGGSEAGFVDVENIPLTAVERIDILPDSASAMYGADAVGGAVNFIMRDKFSGAETVARGGSGTKGDLQEYLVSQTLGTDWDSGSGVLSFEFYRRGPLPAAHRSYAVSNLLPFGGGDFDTALANPGTIVVPTPTGMQTWAIPAGQDGTHLTAAELVPGTQNRKNRYLDAQIIPSQERWNLYGTGRQQLSDRVSLFTEALLGHREATEHYSGPGTALTVPSSNPFYVNPTGGTGPILVDYDFTKDLGPTTVDVGVNTTNATLGMDIDAGGSWTVSAYARYSREKQNQFNGGQFDFSAVNAALADSNPLTAFNPFGDGSHTNPATLAAIRANAGFWLNSELKVVDITADGSVWQLPGGAVKLAVGADHRDQYFATASSASGTTPAASANLSRGVMSAFAEVLVPLFGKQNSLPGLQRLELSAAARYEAYGGFGSAGTPKFGLVWSPLQGLALRGTWARSMRPPTLADLDETHNTVIALPLPNPAAPGALTSTLVWQGKNADVQDERAKSWTAGLDFSPGALPGLSLGLTYFDIAFKDRIQASAFASNILSDPRYAAIVIRDPSAAQIDDICSHSLFMQGTTASCMSFPARAIVDLRVRNLATLLTHGMDFNGAYEHPISHGKLKFGLGGTWIMSFSQAETPDEPLTSVLNTENNPVNLRLRAVASWEFAGFGALLAANFTNSYRDIQSTPERRVDSYTTIDMQLRYDMSARLGSWLENTRVELNAHNVFNVDPPFLNNQLVGLGYDQENADPYGRTVSLQIRKNW